MERKETNMRMMAIISVLIIGFVAGCALILTASAAQQTRIQPGVNESVFPNGVHCYTNNAGGIFCLN